MSYVVDMSRKYYREYVKKGSPDSYIKYLGSESLDYDMIPDSLERMYYPRLSPYRYNTLDDLYGPSYHYIGSEKRSAYPFT